MSPGRRAAWETYLALTTGLLLEVNRLPRGDGKLAVQFAVLIERLRTHTPLWQADGPRLVALAARSWAMHQAGDTAGARVLLRIAARWLFELSRGTAPTRRSLP